MGLITLAERLWNDVLGNQKQLIPLTNLADASGALVTAANPLPASVTETASTAAAVTGTITANGQSVVLPVGAYNGVTVAYWGTFSTINLAFEASYDGGTTYIAINGTAIAGGSPATSTGNVSAAGAWEIYAPGATHVRARSTAYTSGTMNLRLVPFVFSADPAPSVGGGTITAVTTVGTLSAIAAGTNLIGDVGMQPRATAGGLASVARLLAAGASTNPTVVKASAGRVFKIWGFNAATTVRYLKFYNKTTAPTVGTDTPVLTLALQPSAVFDIDLISFGHYFATGIGYALTTGNADADTGALTAGDIVGMNVWFA